MGAGAWSVSENSAWSGAMKITCPRCGAEPNRQCRTWLGNRMYEPHHVRVERAAGPKFYAVARGVSRGTIMRQRNAPEPRRWLFDTSNIPKRWRTRIVAEHIGLRADWRRKLFRLRLVPTCSCGWKGQPVPSTFEGMMLDSNDLAMLQMEEHVRRAVAELERRAQR